MARMGGRLVLLDIPGDDHLALKHPPARRKGLTIRSPGVCSAPTHALFNSPNMG